MKFKVIHKKLVGIVKSLRKRIKNQRLHQKVFAFTKKTHALTEIKTRVSTN